MATAIDPLQTAGDYLLNANCEPPLLVVGECPRVFFAEMAGFVRTFMALGIPEVNNNKQQQPFSTPVGPLDQLCASVDSCLVVEMVTKQQTTCAQRCCVAPSWHSQNTIPSPKSQKKLDLRGQSEKGTAKFDDSKNCGNTNYCCYNFTAIRPRKARL